MIQLKSGFGGRAGGHFGITFSTCFGLFPELFPGIFGMFRDHEMTILGGWRGHSRRFLDVFQKRSPLFSRWFLTIFRQLLFFRGEGGPDSTGPLGPQGPKLYRNSRYTALRRPVLVMRALNKSVSNARIENPSLSLAISTCSKESASLF